MIMTRLPLPRRCVAVDFKRHSVPRQLACTFSHRVLLAAAGSLLCLSVMPMQARAFSDDLFGSRQLPQADNQVFPQWLGVLERHIKEDTPAGDCAEQTFNRCHLDSWREFLDGIRRLPRDQQLERVNRYANNKHYVLDIDNYGVEDYWAVAREFLERGGDCEDYAITKLFSLRWLDYPVDDARIVVLQDTNLRIPHAVLAVARGADIAILDNQISEVVSHRDIVHYRPVYSINERSWWLHLPE